MGTVRGHQMPMLTRWAPASVPASWPANTTGSGASDRPPLDRPAESRRRSAAAGCSVRMGAGEGLAEDCGGGGAVNDAARAVVLLRSLLREATEAVDRLEAAAV